MTDVILKRCTSYNYEKVKSVLESSIVELGGLNKYINKGDKVLLKVNMLTKKKPEEATTTHPVFVEALANILIEYGATVIIGDSPGGPFTKSSLTSMYKYIGMESVSEKTEATLNYNVGSFEKDNPNGVLLKKITMTDMLNDVDKVISVSKLKTHGMMTFTGAVKNLFGTVPGILKAEYHLNMPDYDNFADILVDICYAANPVLSFMDGIVGMEGAGPSAGTPRNINAILVSDSPYHLDKVACSIINLDFNKVYTIKASSRRNFCTMDLSDVNLKGDTIDSFLIKDFKTPKVTAIRLTAGRMPKFLERLTIKLLQSKPVFIREKCIGCKICVDNCPAKVIVLENKKAVVSLENCIRCYCCQELCPEKAVEIHKPFLLSLLKK